MNEEELELEIRKLGIMFYTPELAEKIDYLKFKLKQLRREKGE